MGALLFEFCENFFEAGGGNGFALAFLRDVVILAKGAAHIATAKKDSAAALPSGEAGFFPMVEGGAGEIQGIGNTADAAGLCSVCPALAGADGTYWFHVFSIAQGAAGAQALLGLPTAAKSAIIGTNKKRLDRRTYGDYRESRSERI